MGFNSLFKELNILSLCL